MHYLIFHTIFFSFFLISYILGLASYFLIHWLEAHTIELLQLCANI